ncbi:MAG: FlgK family flagellar hook-associated protein, partial [Planctomycetota bacterium]
MSINGALQIGRSALITSQTGMQVAGHNMANVATEGFHRQSIQLAPMAGEPLGRGQYVGRGVQVVSIRRAVDLALQSRHRDALGQEHAALVDQQFLTAIESLQNELSENDLSTLMSTFFNSFSELANTPEGVAVRSVVIEEGRNIAGRVAGLRQDYQRVLDEIDQSIDTSINRVNELLDQVALVNAQIAETEA